MNSQIRQNKHIPLKMFSKVGQYISHKIPNYNKNNKKNKSCLSLQHKQNETKQLKIYQIANKRPKQMKQQIIKLNNINQPSVGHYKINYSQIQKNCHLYNFKRSVPHFHKQKYSCSQITALNKIHLQEHKKGLNDMKRMVGRQQIKGSIRNQNENPHENRFLSTDKGTGWKNKTYVNFETMLSRSIKQDKNNCSSHYNCNYEIQKQRLDTHIIPFDKQLNRNKEIFLAKCGISNSFMMQKAYQINDKQVQLKKIISRSKQNTVPFYMDKTINSRICLPNLNLKSFQMNCFNPIQKHTKKISQESNSIHFKENSSNFNTII